MQHDTQLIKQANNHKAVRDRLWNPQVTLKRADLEQEREAVASLRAKVAELAAEVAERDRKIWKLELDVADRNARIVGQAERIAMLDNAGLFCRQKAKPVADIVAEVLLDFPGVTWDEITSVRRTRHLVKPRHLCMVAVHEQRPDLSLPAIGRIFKRDHSVVLYAVAKVKAEAGDAESIEKLERKRH